MKPILILSALLACTSALLAAQDRVLADFEGKDYGAWVAEGNAFAPGPQSPEKLYLNREGKALAMSRLERGGDSAQGTLISPPFVIDRRALHFLVGGGNHPNETCVELLIDGKVVRSQAGPSKRELQPVIWDLREFQGKTAQIRLADRKTGQWGHIAADYFVLSDKLAAPSTFGRATDAQSDILLADFEGDSYAPWQAQGNEFAAAPYRPGTDGGPQISGFEGEGIAMAIPGNTPRRAGSLVSPPFEVSRPHLNFLIGGGNQAFRTALSLWVDGEVVLTTSGNGTNELQWVTWDLRPYMGKEAILGIHDLATDNEPTLGVLVDQIYLSNQPKAAFDAETGSVAQAIEQVKRDAVNAIRDNAERAAADPYRPIYHYAPPAQRMNDPNGPAWHNGYHHLFYQHMVFVEHGSAINVHWGHARSKDLVNWETLPLAVRPHYEHGELSVFSGNLAWDKNGEPVQFTTMVPYLPGVFRRIWTARPLDEDWIEWETTPVAPTGLLPQGDVNRNIKDAFPFSAGERRFLVLTDRNIPIFEAVNDDLSEWVYRGPLDEKSAECPNFFEVDGHWIYLASPHAPVRYRIGDFDPQTAVFTQRTEGVLNSNNNFYASTLYRDDQGRTVMHGVTRGQRAGQGWTGALAMPRILKIGDDLRPRMFPPEELKQLRRDHFAITTPIELNNRTQVIDGLEGDAIEIIARFRTEGATAFGLQVRRSADGSRSIPVMWKDGEIIVNRGTKFPANYEIDPATGEVTFRVFLDKGILDACTQDGKVFESRIHYAPLEDLGVAVFAEGGKATLLSLSAWQMEPAAIDHSRLLAAE